MAKLKPLTPAQQSLVEQNLDIVERSIRYFIDVNENYPGLGYDDLFQEGCLALMQAAQSHDAEKGEFTPYAFSVVKNGLCSYCRKRMAKNKLPVVSGSAPLDLKDENSPTLFDGLVSPDSIEHAISENLAVEILEAMLPEFSGTTKLGVEAIILKVKGFNGADIAEMYGVKQNSIGAWIHRAKKKLLQNPQFLQTLE